MSGPGSGVDRKCVNFGKLVVRLDWIVAEALVISVNMEGITRISVTTKNTLLVDFFDFSVGTQLFLCSPPWPTLAGVFDPASVYPSRL